MLHKVKAIAATGAAVLGLSLAVAFVPAASASSGGTCLLSSYNQMDWPCVTSVTATNGGFIQGDLSTYSYWLHNLWTGKMYGPWNIGRDGLRHNFTTLPIAQYESIVLATDQNASTYPNYVHVHFN